MAGGTALRRKRSACCSSPTSRPPSTGLCSGNRDGRLRDDMEPHPAGSGVCALALRLPIRPGATIRDSLGRRDVLLAAESTNAQQWKLAGTAGQIITIDLVSEAF